MALPSNPEPIVTTAAVQSALLAAVGALVAFNVWHPSDVQVGALTTLYLAVSPFVFFFVRSKVTPVAKAVPTPEVTVVDQAPVAAPFVP